MALTAQDQDYLDFAERSRPMLLGCALLMTGEPVAARRLAETVVARRYLGRDASAGLLTAALTDLVHPQPAFLRPPWVHEAGLQLVDSNGAPRMPRLLQELQRLGPQQRACLVLGQYAGLTPPEVAEVLATDVPTVEQWVQQAYRVLAAADPERLQPGRLAAELRGCVEFVGRDAGGGAAPADLQHARLLVRNRRMRQVGGLLAAVLVLVVAAVFVTRGAATAPEADSTPAPPAMRFTPSPVPHVSARCDVRNGMCQATVMREWRTEMARIAASYVDPEGDYFTGYGFSYTPRYESRSFWAGQGGALGLEMFRLGGGATEVYLQVATGYDSAVRCGDITRRACESHRFMDGNRFTLTATTQVSKGMEVQYRPDGDQVITVVARNTTKGSALEVTRGQLLALVQDQRLRLPEI